MFLGKRRRMQRRHKEAAQQLWGQTMQFQGKLKFLFGQKATTSSGSVLPPQMALFCVAVPLLFPSVAEIKMKTMLLRAKHRPGATTAVDARAKPFSGLCEAEMHGRTSHQGISFSDMLHNAENQMKLMNNRENGISLFKVRRNDDQWLWVETSTPLVYRNEYSVIVPQQTRCDRGKGEHLRKPSSILGLKGGRKTPPFNCSPESAGQFTHLNWAAAKHEKEDIKLKFQPNKIDSCFVQDEPFNFCKPVSVAQNHCITNSWALQNASDTQQVSQHTSTCSAKVARSLYSGDQSKTSPQHGGTGHFQPYLGRQHLTMESYTMDSIKVESATITTEALCDLVLPLDIPIKMEYDSDSENRAEYYAGFQDQTWPRENSMLKKQLLGLPDGLHLKTETDFSDPLSPCQKPKNGIRLPCKDRCMTASTHHTNRINVGSQFKAACAKDMSQFHPSKCTYLESILSLQNTDYYSSHLHGLGLMNKKEPSEQACKLHYNFRAHGLAQAIKQEPLDSPSWPGNGHNPIIQKPTMPSPILHKTTDFTFLQ
ncbi:aryl hydrocarbon receptor repressor-like isoform X2 [Rhinatrema bivittatum]|uniref:aryl hydrocarbon receptor repressor-like isoform X2 n=1 Tax=Rhinatrema bivittatum TaxID=194408 RepID=UPI0011269EDC|nr:aryl hydrocarbon receptor repressor-like isoform X2 [Rhinatrema bivittatum]